LENEPGSGQIDKILEKGNQKVQGKQKMRDGKINKIRGRVQLEFIFNVEMR
jgi:hypothetical protein